MLTKDLISASIPALITTDKVYHALQLMGDYQVAHLPVVENEKYLGIVSEEQLLHTEEDLELGQLPIAFTGTSVQATDHFLKALQISVQNSISVVPVLQDQNLLGITTSGDLLRGAAQFLSLGETGGIIVLELEGRNFSFGELSRIIESNDAQITQLNTSTDPETGLMEVTIRINKVEISDIVSSLQRYEYNIKYYFGEELYENELKGNYDNLMHYLKI